MSFGEQFRTTNTGRLVSLGLASSNIITLNQGIQVPQPSDWSQEAHTPVLLFPREDAKPLESFRGRKVQLIVPDGTWKEARKIGNKLLDFKQVECAVLPVDQAPTRYTLRSNRRPGGLATFEAIARAIGVLEGMPTQRSLESLFEMMLFRTMRTKGQISKFDREPLIVRPEDVRDDELAKPA